MPSKDTLHKGEKLMGKIVVMDTETTGLDPSKADLIQIAAIILKQDFTPDKNTQPFYLLIKPAHYHPTKEYTEEIQPAMNVNKLNIEKIMKIGFDPIKAAELFEEWWKLNGGEPLDPLCQNYPFDSGFVRAWLGPIAYSHYFSRYYRDTYVAARFLNDRASFNGEVQPFKTGFNLTKLATELQDEHVKAHDAFDDCLVTAEVYKRMCTLMTIAKPKSS